MSAGFALIWIPGPVDPEALKLMLARAFDQAWARYYRPGRVTLSTETARLALASHLVKIAKGGMMDEDRLAVAGVLHLMSLTPEEPDDFSA